MTTAARRLHRQWAEDRKAFADKWFSGDEEFATEFLESLPYSCIPGWDDAEYVMTVLHKRGDG